MGARRRAGDRSQKSEVRGQRAEGRGHVHVHVHVHVHENTVGRLLGEAARRCGVVRQVTCHALRHTFATLALENGTDNCRCGASAPRALRAA